MDRLRVAGGKVLLLGVGFEYCSMLHLAECIAWRGTIPRRWTGAPMRDSESGQATWVEFAEQIVDIDDDAQAVGDAFMASVPPGADTWSRGKIGAADAILLDAAALVDFAAHYFVQTRPSLQHFR